MKFTKKNRLIANAFFLCSVLLSSVAFAAQSPQADTGFAGDARQLNKKIKLYLVKERAGKSQRNGRRSPAVNDSNQEMNELLAGLQASKVILVVGKTGHITIPDALVASSNRIEALPLQLKYLTPFQKFCQSITPEQYPLVQQQSVQALFTAFENGKDSEEKTDQKDADVVVSPVVMSNTAWFDDLGVAQPTLLVQDAIPYDASDVVPDASDIPVLDVPERSDVEIAREVAQAVESDLKEELVATQEVQGKAVVTPSQTVFDFLRTRRFPEWSLRTRFFADVIGSPVDIVIDAAGEQSVSAHVFDDGIADDKNDADDEREDVQHASVIGYPRDKGVGDHFLQNYPDLSGMEWLAPEHARELRRKAYWLARAEITLYDQKIRHYFDSNELIKLEEGLSFGKEFMFDGDKYDISWYLNLVNATVQKKSAQPSDVSDNTSDNQSDENAVPVSAENDERDVKNSSTDEFLGADENNAGEEVSVTGSDFVVPRPEQGDQAVNGEAGEQEEELVNPMHASSPDGTSVLSVSNPQIVRHQTNPRRCAGLQDCCSRVKNSVSSCWKSGKQSSMCSCVKNCCSRVKESACCTCDAQDIEPEIPLI